MVWLLIESNIIPVVNERSPDLFLTFRGVVLWFVLMAEPTGFTTSTRMLGTIGFGCFSWFEFCLSAWVVDETIAGGGGVPIIAVRFCCWGTISPIDEDDEDDSSRSRWTLASIDRFISYNCSFTNFKLLALFDCADNSLVFRVFGRFGWDCFVGFVAIVVVVSVVVSTVEIPVVVRDFGIDVVDDTEFRVFLGLRYKMQKK